MKATNGRNTFDDERTTRHALDQAVLEHEMNRSERHGTGFDHEMNRRGRYGTGNYNETDKDDIMRSITRPRLPRVQDAADSSIPGNWSGRHEANRWRDFGDDNGWSTVPKSRHTQRRESYEAEQDIIRQMRDDSDIWKDDPYFEEHMRQRNEMRRSVNGRDHDPPEFNKPHRTPGSVASRMHGPKDSPDAISAGRLITPGSAASRANTPHMHPAATDPDEQSREQSQRIRELLAQRHADKHPAYIDKSPSTAKRSGLIMRDRHKIDAEDDLNDRAVDNERETNDLVALVTMLRNFHKTYGDACVIPCVVKVNERLSTLRTNMEKVPDEMPYIEDQIDKEREQDADIERRSEEDAERRDRMHYDDDAYDAAERQHEKFDRQASKIPQYRPRM